VRANFKVACSDQTKTGTYISWSHHPADLLHGVEIRAETSVHREDFLVNDGGNWQAVEAIRKSLP
jgi:hypothetical protein